MDFEAAAKLCGARFVVLKKGLARLERAIGQFMLDLHTNEHGYTEINPPLLVRNDVMFGTGQLPKFEDDQFWAIKGELLCGSARRAIEHRASRPHPDRRSPADQPRSRIHPRRKRTADAPDRADAVLPRGSGRGGRDTRGMIRQHQFTEKSSWSRSRRRETSSDEHERMLACARGSAAPARPALPRDDAVHRRHGLFRAEDLRHRGLDAGAGRGRRLPRDFRAARCAAISRRGAWMRAIADPTASRASCTR